MPCFGSGSGAQFPSGTASLSGAERAPAPASNPSSNPSTAPCSQHLSNRAPVPSSSQSYVQQPDEHRAFREQSEEQQKKSWGFCHSWLSSCQKKLMWGLPGGVHDACAAADCAVQRTNWRLQPWAAAPAPALNSLWKAQITSTALVSKEIPKTKYPLLWGGTVG